MSGKKGMPHYPEELKKQIKREHEEGASIEGLRAIHKLSNQIWIRINLRQIMVAQAKCRKSRHVDPFPKAR